MAESTACISSVEAPLNDQGQPEQSQATVRLKLRHPKAKKKVVWTNETVDNEHMNRKKSKCCCIYEKPHAFGESSTDTDDECDQCRGHVEDKKKSSQDRPSNAETDNLSSEKES